MPTLLLPEERGLLKDGCKGSPGLKPCIIKYQDLGEQHAAITTPLQG